MFRYLSTNTSKRQKVDWLSSVCEISLHYMKEMEQDSDCLCGGGDSEEGVNGNCGAHVNYWAVMLIFHLQCI